MLSLSIKIAMRLLHGRTFRRLHQPATTSFVQRNAHGAFSLTTQPQRDQRRHGVISLHLQNTRRCPATHIILIAKPRDTKPLSAYVAEGSFDTMNCPLFPAPYISFGSSRSTSTTPYVCWLVCRVPYLQYWHLSFVDSSFRSVKDFTPLTSSHKTIAVISTH